MLPQVYDKVKTLRPLTLDGKDNVIVPVGTEAVIIEVNQVPVDIPALGEVPIDHYLLEVSIPDETLVGDHSYGIAEATRKDFEVLEVPPDQMACNVCGGQSKGRSVGVASVPGHAYSVLWCTNCLRENAIPPVCARINWYQCDFDLANMAEWAQEFTVWHDGKYLKFPEWTRTFTPEGLAALKAQFDELAAIDFEPSTPDEEDATEDKPSTPE